MSYDDFDRNQKSTDKELQCVDCPKTFIFTTNEQKFFTSKGLSEPKRCKDCRIKKKANRETREAVNQNQHADPTGRERY